MSLQRTKSRCDSSEEEFIPLVRILLHLILLIAAQSAMTTEVRIDLISPVLLIILCCWRSAKTRTTGSSCLVLRVFMHIHVFPAVLRTVRSKEIKNGQEGNKVSRGVRSVCHHGVINTQWCWSRGGSADRASEHKEWNCKPKVPDTTCYYFWHKPFTIAMKVAMENVILIVCPRGFAPPSSERHTSHICSAWRYVPFFYFVFFAPLPQILF